MPGGIFFVGSGAVRYLLLAIKAMPLLVSRTFSVGFSEKPSLVPICYRIPHDTRVWARIKEEITEYGNKYG